MSNEPRIPDQIISVKKPRIGRRIIHDLLPVMRVELFGAYQFRGKHNRMDRNFNPTVPINLEDKKEWYSSMFRLRIDDKWYRPGKAKYKFLTKSEVAELLLET